jgi:hypothetical protein
MSIIKELCLVCTKELNSTLVVNELNSANQEQDIETLWSKELCEECASMKSKGFILIGAVEEKTTDPKNPYRSGNIWCVTHEVAKQLFEPNLPPSNGMAFLDVKQALEMNLPNVKLDA